MFFSQRNAHYFYTWICRSEILPKSVCHWNACLMYCSSGPNCVRHCTASEKIFRVEIHLLSKYRSVKGWRRHTEVKRCVLRSDQRRNRNEWTQLFFTECFLWLYRHPCILHPAKLSSSDFVLFPKMSLKHCGRCILQLLKQQQQQSPSGIQQASVSDS